MDAAAVAEAIAAGKAQQKLLHDQLAALKQLQRESTVRQEVAKQKSPQIKVETSL